MGRVFLAFLSVFSWSYLHADHILLPENPKSERQLNDDYYQKQHQRNLEKKRQMRQEQQLPLESLWQKERDVALQELSVQEAAMDFGLNLGLGLLSYTKVIKERKDYSLDPPVMIRAFWSLDKNPQNHQWRIWVGARGCFLGGTGVHENTSGRFGLTYFGPMIAVGKMNAVSQDFASHSGNNRPTVARSGFMISGGIAGLHQLGEQGRGQTTHAKDFEDKVLLDRPNFWLEYHYIWLHYKALETSLFIGAQAGENKYFMYMGTNIGAWL